MARLEISDLLTSNILRFDLKVEPTALWDKDRKPTQSSQNFGQMVRMN